MKKIKQKFTFIPFWVPLHAKIWVLTLPKCSYFNISSAKQALMPCIYSWQQLILLAPWFIDCKKNSHGSHFPPSNLAHYLSKHSLPRVPNYSSAWTESSEMSKTSIIVISSMILSILSSTNLQIAFKILPIIPTKTQPILEMVTSTIVPDNYLSPNNLGQKVDCRMAVHTYPQIFLHSDWLPNGMFISANAIAILSLWQWKTFSFVLLSRSSGKESVKATYTTLLMWSRRLSSFSIYFFFFFFDETNPQLQKHGFCYRCLPNHTGAIFSHFHHLTPS